MRIDKKVFEAFVAEIDKQDPTGESGIKSMTIIPFQLPFEDEYTVREIAKELHYTAIEVLAEEN